MFCRMPDWGDFSRTACTLNFSYINLPDLLDYSSDILYLCPKQIRKIYQQMKQIAYSLFFVMACLLSSCKSGPVTPKATGFAYEIVVVMDESDWKGAAGEAINDELTAPIPYLPQPEPCMRVTYAPPVHFNGLLTYVRNILIVDIDPTVYTKVSFNSEANRWASNQWILTMKAPSAEAITEYIAQNPTSLTDFFSNKEIDRAVATLDDAYSTLVKEKLRANHDLDMNAPESMAFYKDTTDFFWATNNANTGRMDLVVYTFPYESKNTFTPEYLIAKRDSVMKANMPGAFPGSYMATETRLGVGYSAITVQGKYCGVMRGLWKMVGDMMGGPFVSHIRLDEQNQRVVVAEGFVYAPETSKRNFIRRMEASLFTLRLPGEFEVEGNEEK